MGLTDWITETRDRGFGGLDESLYQFYLGLWRQLDREYGTNVFDEEWDLLVIMDACAASHVAHISDEYPFLSTDTTYSNASATPVWMERTMSEEYSSEMEKTAYITSNPWSNSKVSSEDLGSLEEVWRYGWDDEVGTVQPETVTNAALRHRDEDWDRMIVHYLQPHRPFLNYPKLSHQMSEEFTENEKENVFYKLRHGEVSEELVREAFRDNLRSCLSEVNRLLRNIDAEETVITSDHGNMFGKHLIYDHPHNVPHPDLRRVPWVETTAVNKDDESPEQVSSDDFDNSVEDRLKDLGYV